MTVVSATAFIAFVYIVPIVSSADISGALSSGVDSVNMQVESMESAFADDSELEGENPDLWYDSQSKSDFD